MLTLKQLQIHDRLSQETIAFTATVCWEGMGIAHASNAGRGGPTTVHLLPRAAKITPETARLIIRAARELLEIRGLHGGVFDQVAPDLAADLTRELVGGAEALVDTALEQRERERVRRWDRKHATRAHAAGRSYACAFDAGNVRAIVTGTSLQQVADEAARKKADLATAACYHHGEPITYTPKE